MGKGIYIASPLGFSEAGREFMNKILLPRIKKLGYEIIDPWKLTPSKLTDPVLKMPYGKERKAAWQKLNPIIGANNRKGIEQSVGVFAVLDGVDVDSGTASEIGYAAALGKPVLGYRGDFRLSADNEGSTVNLQVEYFVKMHGGEIITSIKEITKPRMARVFAMRK